MTTGGVDVTALTAAAACGVRLWRGPRTRHLTVVVKALVELVHGGRGKLVPGANIATKERHYRGLPTRSVEEASDLAPYLARCDVTLRGHAHALGGQPVPASAVRLAVHGQAPLLDRTIHVLGDRAAAPGAPPQPFQHVALDWEHAFGGKASPDNPVGRGADAAGAGAQPPNLVDPIDPRRPACFAPLSRYWGPRARALGATPRGAVDADEAQVGDGFDWGYFQVAPAEQQVPYLLGEEWVILDGVHPLLPRVQSQLPSMRGAALVFVHAGGVYGPARPVELHADTLAIDADRLIAAISWRGSLVLEAGVEPAQLKVLGALQIDGGPIAWLDPRTLEPPRAPGAAAAGPASAVGAATVILPEDAPPLSGTMAASPVDVLRSATPFSSGTPFSSRTPMGPPPAPPPPAALPPAAPPPAAEAPRLGTVNLSPDDDYQASLLPTTPFRDAATPEEALEGARRAAAASPQPEDKGATGLGRTVGLSFGEAQLAARRAVTPFPTEQVTRSPSSARGDVALDPGVHPIAVPAASPAPQRRRVPLRESPNVPIVNLTPLDAATTPWQVQPPQDSLTVIVKGTFDLVPGGAMTPREEPDVLDGDVHVEDDLAKGLLYASDFAVVKPRADVVLTGHAHAPDGKPAPVVRVTFRFGTGSAPQGFERSIAVLGDRAWKRSGSSMVPGDPAPFTSMPLVYERAFGGPGQAPNPIGVGAGGPAGGDPRLPNLEDPRRPLMSPTDTPPPACFGPIPPGWAERSSRLGTYDATWQATRWPYFPVDFDWGSFQAAPSGQQVAHLRGDEPFEIRGMHPEHPKLEGKLPGLRVRAFALEREDLGGDFFEIALHLDTVAIDLDAMKANLVWRGLCEVTDDEGPELETLFIHTEVLAEAPLPLPVVKELLFEAVAPDVDEEEPPGPALTPPPAPPVRDPAMREACVAHLASGAPLDGLDLAGADLSRLDFSGRSMIGIAAKESSLRGARLGGADLAGAQLAGADLTEADLRSANLAGADLTGATLEGAQLGGAMLGGADLSYVRADRAVFSRARGEDVQLVGGSFVEARFDAAEMPGADFTEARLDGAIFDEAVMPEIRLHYAKGVRARFDRARIEDARGDDATLADCSFAGVHAPGSMWEKATLTRSTFTGARLDEASFTRAACERASFQRIVAPESRFARARLAGANLAGADLREADLERADLTGADLRGANLHAAETWKARLKGARLEDAIVTGSKLAPPAPPRG